jgi:hypothetical protein
MPGGVGRDRLKRLVTSLGFVFCCFSLGLTVLPFLGQRRAVLTEVSLPSRDDTKAAGETLGFHGPPERRVLWLPPAQAWF